MVTERNDSVATFPDTSTVHGLMEKQIARTPHGLAVVHGDARMTYREMGIRADRLAALLSDLGVGPEVVVPVCIERSPQMVVALLGILKAGGAFLPLDPRHPASRLEFMLHDVKASVVLTQRRLAARLPLRGLKAVFVDDPSNSAIADPPRAGGSASGRRNLAYVVYTSGSTGRPKAVCLPHQPLTNLFHWYGEIVAPGSRVLQFAPLSFDVSLHEVFAAIASGGQLHIFPTEEGVDTDELGRYVDDHAITRAVLPPVVLQRLAEDFAEQNSLGSLREIVSTGDRLTITPAVTRFFERRPQCALRNHYGATESQGGTVFTFPSPPASWRHSAPLGAPIDNVQVYVLDEVMRPVAANEVGEVYFGGVGHARGYLGLPRLTTERFVPSMFGAVPGARLYRTGDLARCLPDSTIEFVGRVDHQVKVRGFRVEPGEIEACLSRTPAIREAVVVAHPLAGEDQQLVAYVVPTGNDPTLATTLREFLENWLPEYMIPALFVPLGALPLTANGKIDRSSLPVPDSGRPDIRTEYSSPGTPLEQTLASIWAQVLRLDQVGVNDDFFEIGGDSVKAMQVVARLREAGIDIPVRRIFEWPTIADLASLEVGESQ